MLQELTTLDPNQDGGNILALDDPELFRLPPSPTCASRGSGRLGDKEIAGLRAYLSKGGFLIVDDFVGRHWSNFAEQMKKVLPNGQLLEIGNDHAVFDSFFRVEDPRAFPHPYFPGDTRNYLGIFEDNDPSQAPS